MYSDTRRCAVYGIKLNKIRFKLKVIRSAREVRFISFNVRYLCVYRVIKPYFLFTAKPTNFFLETTSFSTAVFLRLPIKAIL